MLIPFTILPSSSTFTVIPESSRTLASMVLEVVSKITSEQVHIYVQTYMYSVQELTKGPLAEIQIEI